MDAFKALLKSLFKSGILVGGIMHVGIQVVPQQKFTAKRSDKHWSQFLEMMLATVTEIVLINNNTATIHFGIDQHPM